MILPSSRWKLVTVRVPLIDKSFFVSDSTFASAFLNSAWLALGFGSLFVLCFMEEPLETYEDVLRNDTALFMRYRRELIARGVFEMPESLGRSHISASHTHDDIDRSLEIAEAALAAALDARA